MGSLCPYGELDVLSYEESEKRDSLLGHPPGHLSLGKDWGTWHEDSGGGGRGMDYAEVFYLVWTKHLL